MKKILIFHTTIGLGHKYIAENIGFRLQEAGFEVKLADIGTVQKGKMANTLISAHGFINKHMDWFWSFLYKSKMVNFVSSPFRVPLASKNYESTLKFISEFNPDLVITVQTTASAVLSYLKKKKLYTKPWAISFSDFHLHPFWLYKNCDYYFANIQEQKDEMVKMGYNGDKISVCGITLKPKVEVNAESVKSKLQIENGQKVVLVGIGSLGIGLSQSTLDDLVSINGAKVIIACGKNKELQSSLLEKYKEFKNVLVLGFYSPMDELYSIADVFVTKPGGLTTAEAVRSNLPMIVTHWLPGQEEWNISYLINKKLIICKPKSLAASVRGELETGSLRKSIMVSSNARQLVGDGSEVIKAVNSLLHT